MKKRALTILLTLLTSVLTQAQEIDVRQIESMGQTIDRATLSPSESCDQCAGQVDQEVVHKSLTLNQADLTISTNYVGGEDYVMALKRTPSTPDKIKLKIEYGERVCDRMVATQNPISGGLGFDCLFYKTEKRSKTIHLDFSKASALLGDEHQSLRLVIHKDRDSRTFEHKLVITDGLYDQINEARRFAGVFGHEYEIERVRGSRSPAVLATPEEE